MGAPGQGGGRPNRRGAARRPPTQRTAWNAEDSPLDTTSVETTTPPRRPWWLYVLWSAALRRTYVGISDRVGPRLRAHNGERPGGARSTRAGRPWALAAVYGPFTDRSAASKAERQLKAARGAARLRWAGAPAASLGEVLEEEQPAGVVPSGVVLVGAEAQRDPPAGEHVGEQAHGGAEVVGHP